MQRLIICILSVLLVNFSTIAQEIKYPNIHGIGESSIGFAVLNLALEEAGGDYQLSVDLREAEWSRVAYMLETGSICN